MISRVSGGRVSTRVRIESHEHLVVAAREIGAADRTEEDHVADDRHRLRGRDEDDVPRRVAGSEEDFKLGTAEGDVDAGDEVVVGGRQIHGADAEGRGLGGDVVVEDAVVGGADGSERRWPTSARGTPST